MNKLLGPFLLGCLCLGLSFGSIGCQKPAPSKPTNITLEKDRVDLAQGDAITLKVTSDNVEGMDDGTDGLTAKLIFASNTGGGKNDGTYIELTADKKAKLGQQKLSVKNKSSSVPLLVTVVEAKKKDDTKKDDTK